MPAKSARYVWHRLAFACGLLRQVTPRDGWTVRCHPAARSHFEVFRTDPQQAEELEAFFRYAQRGMQFLDVGAHYGLFALAALHGGGTAAKVVCVEPSHNAMNVLRTNLVANDASRSVRLIEAALGPEDGQLEMLTTGPAGADYLIVPVANRGDTVCIPQRSLKSVLREESFHPTHIKMDIEGYECEVVRSNVALLGELKPTLFLELHGDFLAARGKDPLDVLANLRRAAYRTFLVAGRTVDEQELKRRHFNVRVVCLP